VCGSGGSVLNYPGACQSGLGKLAILRSK